MRHWSPIVWGDSWGSPGGSHAASWHWNLRLRRSIGRGGLRILHMPLMETIKEKVEKITGWGRPKRREVEAVLRPRKPNVFRFADDGTVPNDRSPRFEAAVRIDLGGASPHRVVASSCWVGREPPCVAGSSRPRMLRGSRSRPVR